VLLKHALMGRCWCLKTCKSWSEWLTI